ncbi:MAG: SdpI family protein [Chitinophagales bacterium]
MQKFLKRIVWLIIVIPVMYLAIVWNKLPGKIAMHFDIHGNADQYDSKNEFLLFMGIMTIVSAGVYLLLTNIYRIDPKKYAAENKDRLRKIAFAVVAFLCAIDCFVIYIGVQGSLKLNIRFLFVLIGVFWAVIGNYMNNLRPNYFAGFRLPWTLENEDNWRSTHHLASKLWFAGGLLIAVISILTSATVSIIALFTISLIVIIIPIVHSYRFYKKQKSANSVK